jgi:hypothetical protein
VNDRLVYRSIHSARVSSSFSAANRAGTAKANSAGSAIWGRRTRHPRLERFAISNCSPVSETACIGAYRFPDPSH